MFFIKSMSWKLAANFENIKICEKNPQDDVHHVVQHHLISSPNN